MAGDSWNPLLNIGNGEDSDGSDEYGLYDRIEKRSNTSRWRLGNLINRPRAIQVAIYLTISSVLLSTWALFYLYGMHRMSQKIVNTLNNQNATDDADRPLILYAYHETENARENAEFFIRHGLHDGADFVFISNGETDIYKLLPNEPHITYIQRDNTCMDLGAYSEVLQKNDNALLKAYKKFIMINASIRGPFMPTWSNDCWSDAYLRPISDETKLVGMTFNCRNGLGVPHVQSMVLATDRTGIETLMEKGPMGRCFTD